MKINYQKSPNRSYMIINTDATYSGTKDEQITRADNILTFYEVELDENKYQIWYDITKLRSVQELLSSDSLKDIGIMSTDALIQRVRSALEDISSKYLISSTL